MKRLVMVFRKFDGRRVSTVRLTIPNPVEELDPQELRNDLNVLKQANVVPEGFEPDEVRLTETNVSVLVNLIE